MPILWTEFQRYEHTCGRPPSLLSASRCALMEVTMPWVVIKRLADANWYIVGGNPDGNGGGLIEATFDITPFNADRKAARYVTQGYRDVRVISNDKYWRGV